ncbi:MAG: DUF4097 domain-containing protein [Gammaproteobacteria bacterium]|nr:DUF4097 domain-containing protein [Gammaproteobacteria bacterium]
MNTHTRIKLLTASALLLLSLLAAQAQAADGSFEERLTLGEAVVLEVDTGSGSIEVRSGPGDEASIRGDIRVDRGFLWSKRGDAEELVQQVKDNPPIKLTDGRLRVGSFDDRSIGRKVSISYEIVVPEGTEVIADAGSGSITITDIAAPVSAEAGSGSVTLENIGGSVKADTGSGSIHADGVAGDFHGSSGSGRIYLLQTAPGDVVVSTGSGSSELTGVAGSVRARAGSGGITIDGRLDGDWRIDTGSGTVRVALPEDAAFDLQAESSSGGIDIDHPLTVEGRVSNKELRGKVRGGGPLLKIDTGSGGIRIR